MMTIPARSRFRVESQNLKDLGSYVTNLAIDCFSKTVKIKVLDVILDEEPIVHNWIVHVLNNPGKEKLTLHQHDANGNVLYKKILTEIKLNGHVCNHDYSCDGSDLQDHDLWFTYEELQIVKNVN